ncbi:reverse transcriptase domain-containing protein [Tanacetum coccineum]
MGNPLAGGASTYQGGYIPQAFTNNSVPLYNGLIHPTVIPSSSYPFYAQSYVTNHNICLQPKPCKDPCTDLRSTVTLLFRLIENYPLPDGLKMPSRIGSYDGKGDPYNFLHLFKGAIRMQKWLMPVACQYTLKDFARIWWNSQKTGRILNYEDLKAKFRSHFSQQNKFTKTHLAVHNIKQREGESTRAFITRYRDDTLQILGLHEEQRISGCPMAILASSSEVPSVLEFLQRRKLEAKKALNSSDKTKHTLDISKLDISKASSAGEKLCILKPSCERNGITPTLKESLSPTSGSKVPNSPLTGESNLLIVKASAD